MSGDVPFGFSPPDPDDESGSSGSGESGGLSGSSGGSGPTDPFAALFGSFGGGPGGGAPDLGAALQRIGKLLSWQGGPVNWDLAKEAAREVVAAQGDKSVGDADRRAVADAVRLADLWLDPVSTFAASSAQVRSWSRAEWVEGTLPVWKELVEPVAERVVDAMGTSLGGSVPDEMNQLAGPMIGVLRQVGVSMWGGQVGQALGSLAGEVVGSTDIGLPLVEPGTVVLLPANVRAYGEGLGISERDVLVYLALREAAHHRLFSHVPWLRGHLVSLVESFARGITIDMSRIEEAVRDLDPTHPEALQQALEGGLFEPQTTPQQQTALERLETALALVEGWVDDVVTEATAGRLGTAGALRETVRRRRATGGPAEQTFATLVGLQLRPRRSRDAAALWAAIRAERGVEGRDAVWAHPDLLPTAEELSDPQAYLHRDEPFDLRGLESAPPPPEPQSRGPEGSESGEGDERPDRDE